MNSNKNRFNDKAKKAQWQNSGRTHAGKYVP